MWSMLPNEAMYPYTAKEARDRGELELWRANFRSNCACAGAIELAIRRDFDGMHAAAIQQQLPDRRRHGIEVKFPHVRIAVLAAGYTTGVQQGRHKLRRRVKQSGQCVCRL